MAGFKIWTDLPADKTYRLARQAAEDLAFAVRPLTETSFSAKKGSKGLSLLIGALSACDFQVFVEDLGQDREVRIERNAVWWTGLIGAQRNKARAKELSAAIAARVQQEGGKVLQEKEF